MKTLSELVQYLEEKLVIVGKGKPYGQVIFLAGGAGSGKGFAISNFIQSSQFKVFDPDEMKMSYLKWNDIHNKYPELKGRDLRNPNDVSFLHQWVKSKGSEDKKINTFLSIARAKDILPNIIFDRTLKDNSDFAKLVPMLLEAGYRKENMHLIWVLTDFRVAVQQNFERRRTVPVNILIQTHAGAAKNMQDMLTKNYPYQYINGDAFVILGGPSNTVMFEPSKQSATRVPNMVVKDFKYIKVKEAGQALDDNDKVNKKILNWVYQNAPSKSAIDDFLDDEEEKDAGGPTASRQQTLKRFNIPIPTR